jgi:hypothetical protein
MTEAKRRPGPPTLYRPEYAEQSERLTRLGATDKDLSEFFHVNLTTIGQWRLAYPDFADAVKLGKDEADERVAQSLHKRATGFSYDCEDVAVLPSGQVVQTTKVVYVPPETRAAALWLSNRRPKEWALNPRGARKALDFGNLDGSARSIADASVHVLRLMAAGELSVEEGQAAGAVLQAAARAIETGQLEAQVIELENPKQITHERK